jgi:hypothetical protein
MTNDSDRDARRLVLGLGIGYEVEQLRVFVESLRATGYSGDAMMIVKWPALEVSRYLRRHGFDVVRVFQTRSFSRSIHGRRYGIYARYLRARAGRYDQVMMSDTRDVVFQKNPFDGITAPNCHFYLEAASKLIGDEPTNRRWMHGVLPPDQAKALDACRICCGGITIGSTAALLDYLDRMARMVKAIPFRIYREIGHGYDQAPHNVLAFLTPELAPILVENNRHIATMALEPRSLYRIDERARITLADGHMPAISHQYDRFDDLRQAVEARFPATFPEHSAAAGAPANKAFTGGVRML